jgi:hypothetical protein
MVISLPAITTMLPGSGRHSSFTGKLKRPDSKGQLHTGASFGQDTFRTLPCAQTRST